MPQSSPTQHNNKKNSTPHLMIDHSQKAGAPNINIMYIKVGNMFVVVGLFKETQ
jgi:hypothetical protein